MTNAILHHYPHACSQVCLFALEHTGVPYELNLVDLAANEQATPEFSKISPLGKVPALSVEGVVVLENAAILTYVANLKPKAGLFPDASSPLATSEQQSGLSFCGGTLHPIIRGIAMPARLTDGDTEPVRSRARSLAEKNFDFAEQRLMARGWWLGEWSIIDVYLNWAMQTAKKGGYDLTRFTQLANLEKKLLARPTFAKVMKMEQQLLEKLAAKRAQL